MSVNITVNGKFKACSKPSILDDPVRVKKQLECELRKQRLLEVREESKNLARKIRNDVAAEKERQLRNLEAIKAKELECWRQHVLDQRNNEYRQAIFQIGAAHHAAKLENEAMAERKSAKDQHHKQFRKEMNQRLGVKTPHSAKKVLQTAGTQTPNVLLKDKRKKTPRKRKRKSCPKVHTSTCHCSSAESETESAESSEEEENRATNVGSKSPTTKSVVICACPNVIKCPCTSSSSNTSTLSSTLADEEEDSKAAKKPPVLSRNPTVLVDIDVDSNDSVIITPGEIKDKHTQSNRQFSHVVRDSSPKKPKRSSMKDSTATIGPATTSATTSKVPKKRFTQISQLINSKSATSGSQPRSPPRPPPPSVTAASLTSTQKSPRKSSTSGNVSRDVANTNSGVTITLDSGSKSDKSKSARDGSVGRIQSYDYNNKYTREYPHPTEGLVHEPSIRDRCQPNAMQQAEIERELVDQKEQERERMRSRSEERGRKALEREQVRRDCQELTDKLDALTQQYPQLLNPADPSLLQCHQLQENRAARLEQKRTAAVEELLLRPAIITCPEVGQQQIRVASPHGSASAISGNAGDLNLGAPSALDQINNTGSSDSCGSIILGYVDEQQRKIRNDLNKYAGSQPNQNVQKAERLKSLLQRIEELRKALCEELNKKGSDESMQEVINGVSDVRRERERLINNEAFDEAGRRSPIQKHLRDMQKKEAVLEQKLRELCKMQKKQGAAKEAEMKDKKEGIMEKPDGKECRVLATGGKPLEIIIKLKNEGGRHSKTKSKKSAKSPRKLSTLIDTPTRRLGLKRSTSSLRAKPQKQHEEGHEESKQVNRQNSYDSNSTSYRSLPPRINNEVGALVDRFELNQEQGEEEEVEEGIENGTAANRNGTIEDYNGTYASAGAPKSIARPATSTQRSARLNPLIAHYVQRLLGMSRNSVRALGVSSSEIDTPSSSIMNISSNRTGPAVDVADSQERIQRVQQFIEDNRSFISELEDTLRSQSDVTLETSLRVFEEVWQQRLRNGTQSKRDALPKEQKAKQQKEVRRGSEQRANAAISARGRLAGERQADKTEDRDRGQEMSMNSKKGARDVRNSAPLEETTSTILQSQRASAAQRPQPQASKAAQPKQQRQRQQVQQEVSQTRVSADRSAVDPNAQKKKSTHESQHKRDIAVSTEERRAEEQIARYEQLTENCTHRIAELTKLIQKVRTEKKRLMEITLSSVSEGRNSTEYIELPDGTRRRSNASATDKNASVSSSGSSGESSQSAPTTQPTTTGNYTLPGVLEQQAAASSGEVLSAQDSIAILEKNKATGISRDSGISISRPVTAQDMEPPSQASVTTTTHPSSHGATRKNRPPPTMQRYSPNFAEDDVVHELSTILEVDTPVTSRINATATGSTPAAAAAAEASRSRRLQPQPFPTFEEYAREMNLDVTRLDADTSMRIHQEFEMLITSLCAAPDGAVPDYREFPSLSAYLRNLSAHHEGGEKNQSPETLDDLIACLRVANLSIKAFPSRQDYMRQMKADSASAEFLDSASIENITDSRPNTNTETESESINIEEELRRRQILQHSFRTAEAKAQFFSSTTRDGAELAPVYSRIFTTESGIEKLTSTSENGSSEFERQLFNLGMKWPATMRARTKKAEAAGSSNTSSSPERIVQAGVARTAQLRTSPKKTVNDLRHKSPQRSPDTTLRGASPQRVQAVSISTTKEVQFEQRTDTYSPTQSSKRQPLNSSPMRDAGTPTLENAPEHRKEKKSPVKDVPPNSSTGHDATRHSRSSRRAPHSSSDCEFISDFGRPLNLRDFLTKELLKHASSSSSSTTTDDSLRSAFLQSIIDTLTPRTNAGSNQLDRQKTSTPVTHSGPSDPHSSGNRSGSSNVNTPSQLFSGESGLSSVRFFERSITRTYPHNAPSPAAAAAEQQKQEVTTEKGK